ncbi:MAG: transcription-repair coupling factor [Chitinivibrionales bacterium]|nr:transcription-repair coupling factor [Chitinivibrionales bacterium]
MNVEFYKDHWPHGSIPQAVQWAEEQPESALFTGCTGSSDALCIAELFAASERSLFVLTESTKRAEILAHECATFVGEDSIFLLPARDAVPYNMKSPFGPTVEARFETLSRMLNRQKGIYIAPSSCLLERVVPSNALFNQVIRLNVGDEVTLENLSAWLIEIGFHKETMVSDLGTFSVRGGIVDIYPFMYDNPIRLEFWGDTIESIREFDIFSQKSRTRLSSLEIFPMKEICFDDEALEAGLESMRGYAEETGIDFSAIDRLEHQWKLAGDQEGIEWFLHWLPKNTASVLDYLPRDCLVVWNDIIPVDRRLEIYKNNYTRHLERVPELFLPFISPPEKLLLNKNDIDEELTCFCRIFMGTLDLPPHSPSYACSFAEPAPVSSNLEQLYSELTAQHQKGFDITILAGNVGTAERLIELIHEQCPFVTVFLGYLERGYVDKHNSRIIYAEDLIFRRKQHHHIKPKKSKGGIPISSFEALSPGDFVVHVDHGIGKFVGIQRISAGQANRDCMALQFKDRAKLFVPIEDFHKVQKYVAKESVVPSLSKLGSEAWNRLKKRTRDSLREMARELIELYAKRQYHEGIAFAPDAPWQKEFEDAFIYDETPDQLTAIKQVKKDMETKKPMDRLICGDVGFGKTEVAMRAAFKAVMNGYQVAVLAPTTILAMQHNNTFSDRMANFPIKIDVLCRFLKPKEQKEIVAKAKNGEIDILVGTHRLLSKDVSFKNLGLLIVDEEQKFGVKHKERLKQFRSKIDVLSMTATPIPRTLHLSLIGARDLSTMNTPPRNRLPVQTSVSEYHDEMVKNAIENELDRGGQVYVVHNRIKDLYVLKDKIEQLVPKARVIAAHGQMHERELEIIMREFVAGRYDVLVSTVIIENGLDIANVNTILVNRADMMGLSQLYQLRGRVGRSSEQAFAYLLTPAFKKIDEHSLRRLFALEQYTELGSGFQIAMRDLEIRGAGNILGTRQHGCIAAVGFEMYCRLLQEAVKEAKGEKIDDETREIQVDIPLEAHIPSDYVSDGAARIRIYQELSSVTSTDQIEDIEQDIIDRFGPAPPPVHTLLLLMNIKVLARNIGCSKIAVDTDRTLSFNFEGNNEEIKEQIKKILSQSARNFEVVYQTPISLKTTLSSKDTLEKAFEVKTLIEEIVK